MLSKFESEQNQNPYAPVSFSHGLIHKQIITKLPYSHKVWDEVADRLPDLASKYRTPTLCS